MTPLTSVYTAVLYINICCFISDFRPVVNINYASSPKFVQSRKGLLISAACVSKFRSFWSLPKNSTWDLFMRQPAIQIDYKCCINFAKTEFLYRIYCISWYFRCIVLNHWKIQNSGDSQDVINNIIGRSINGERATERSQWRQSSMTSFVSKPFVAARTCL